MSKQRYLAEVRELRDGWSNDIPASILHSDTSNAAKFKVRKAWFQVALLQISSGIRKGYASPYAKRQYHNFVNYMERTKMRWTTKPTKPREIAVVNDILDSIIDNLE